jgi:DNA-binding IclR family transcriptional regulator
MMVLERHRLVSRNPQNGYYIPGIKLFELGSKAVPQHLLLKIARGYLEKLVYETGETAHLCVLDEGEVLYLEKVESSHSMRISSNIGSRNPVHTSAVGKALLAYLSEEEVDNILKNKGLKAYTRHSITNAAQLKIELLSVRERGYAVDNEEGTEGVRCVGAAVRDHEGNVVASISVAGPAFRITDDKIPVIAKSVINVTDQLSNALGNPIAGDKVTVLKAV